MSRSLKAKEQSTWEASSMNSGSLEKVFNLCSDFLTDEEILEICEEIDARESKLKVKKIQGGLGMASQLPYNSTYKGKIFEI